MNTVAVTTDSKTIAMIELTLIQESPDNPRQTYDHNALQELAKSIASEGIQVPLLVRVFDGEARYELIAGHRRIRAAKIAGLTEVPCVLRQYTDEEARAARIIENLLREGLTPLDEADLPAKLGKKERYARLRLCLLSADAAVYSKVWNSAAFEDHHLRVRLFDQGPKPVAHPRYAGEGHTAFGTHSTAASAACGSRLISGDRKPKGLPAPLPPSPAQLPGCGLRRGNLRRSGKFLRPPGNIGTNFQLDLRPPARSAPDLATEADRCALQRRGRPRWTR
jgi:hypothetical protein